MFAKGKSGNPSGRPKGIQDKRVAVRGLLNPHAPELIQKAVEMALGGDTTALKLCLDRLVPALKPTGTALTIDVAGSLSERGEAVLAAITSGQVDPITGGALIGALTNQAKLKEITDIEERLAELERGYQA